MTTVLLGTDNGEMEPYAVRRMTLDWRAMKVCLPQGLGPLQQLLTWSRARAGWPESGPLRASQPTMARSRNGYEHVRA